MHAREVPYGASLAAPKEEKSEERTLVHAERLLEAAEREVDRGGDAAEGDLVGLSHVCSQG